MRDAVNWHQPSQLYSLAMTTIHTHYASMKALDALRDSARVTSKVNAQMATGQRIQTAQDDAASLAVSHMLSAQYHGIQVATRNLNDGISLAQTAEAALVSVTDAMQRMRELAVQAASGLISDAQRAHLNQEYQALKAEISQVVTQTRWNGFRVFRELSETEFEIQSGPNASDRMTLTIPKVYATGDLQAFPNGDFETGNVNDTSVSGWTIGNERIQLNGTSMVGGWPTPTDTTKPAPSGGDAVSMSSGAFSSRLVGTDNPQGGSKSLLMESTGVSVASYGVVHGPYIISNSPLPMVAGDKVSFDWKAQGGGDAYDVYAYLLNTDTGATFPLLNESGSSGAMTTSWATVEETVPEDGNYKFVFVSGTFDATGGTAAGARLYIDNIDGPGVASPTLNTTDVTTTASASQAMTQIDADMGAAQHARAVLGAFISRVNHAADGLIEHFHNLAESRSRMADTDYAQATMEVSRAQITQSGAQFVLAQSRRSLQAAVGIVESNDKIVKG